MLTCNGTVEVNDLKISTSNGDLVRFLEYRPKTATADNTVPAIVYSPGNDSTAESVRLCSSELARRGYAVYVLDLLSAGHSSEGVGNSSTVIPASSAASSIVTRPFLTCLTSIP